MTTRPKTLQYADALAAVEQRIVDALPDVIDGLIAKAREGDTKAAVYLCDRILGRVAGAAIPPASDKTPPFTEEAFEREEEERREREALIGGLFSSGARKGA